MRKRADRLTQVQFYKLCQALKEMAKTFEAEHTMQITAATQLSTMLGFPVNAAQVRAAMQTTGIHWNYKRERTGKSKTSAILAKEIIRIRLGLGLEVTEELKAISQARVAPAKIPLADPEKAVQAMAKIARPEVVPVRVAGK